MIFFLEFMIRSDAILCESCPETIELDVLARAFWTDYSNIAKAMLSLVGLAELLRTYMLPQPLAQVSFRLEQLQKFL